MTNSENKLEWTPRNTWVYDGSPLEEPLPKEKQNDSQKEKGPTFKTSPNQLKAIRKYEEAIKQDALKLEKRTHQKNFSGAKSFITYAAKTDDLLKLKSLIDSVLEWSKGIENFDELKRPERKIRYNNK